MTTFSIELFGQINYWAVVVAGLAAFIIGGIWYSPALFENTWMATNGYTAEQVQQTISSMVPFGFAAALLVYIALALVFAFISVAVGVSTVQQGIILAVLIWFGFVASSGLMVTLFSPRPIAGWVIDAGFQLTFLVVVGAIIGAWR